MDQTNSRDDALFEALNRKKKKKRRNREYFIFTAICDQNRKEHSCFYRRCRDADFESSDLQNSGSASKKNLSRSALVSQIRNSHRERAFPAGRNRKHSFCKAVKKMIDEQNYYIIVVYIIQAHYTPISVT